MESVATFQRFAVIGAGRLGASLGLALRAKGLELLGYTAATPEGRARADRWLGGVALSTLEELVALAPDLYFIAVPDSALKEVAATLAGLLQGHPGVLVAHTSGATSVDALEPCALVGASTFVFHPLQTFTDPLTGRDRFEGIAVAVTPAEGEDDSPAAVAGFALALLLGAHPFILPDDNRTLYHCAATIACNYFVTLEHHALRLFIEAGLPSEQAPAFCAPLVRSTLDNIQTQGTIRALTGPVSRGDVHTVRDHMAALANDAPDLLPVYSALGSATLDIVRARHEVDAAIVDELADLFSPAQGYHAVVSNTERTHR